MAHDADLKTGQTLEEKRLLDELCATKAAVAELVQRLGLAHATLHSEQHAHEQTKATLTRLRRKLAKQSITIQETDDD